MFVLSDYHFGIVKNNEKTDISKIKNKKGGFMNNLNGMTLPTCDILVNGQKRKLYGKKKNKVYLHNGDNFQLKLFNPLQERIGVQLRMNGIKVDNDLLILKPGQEITIERFIGTNRKLSFSTYEIDKSNKEAVKAIEKNGILDVIFWNEKIPVQTVYTNTSTINYRAYPLSGSTITISGDDVIVNGNLTVNGNLKTAGISGSSGTFGFAGVSGTNGTNGTNHNSRIYRSLSNTNISNDKDFWFDDKQFDFNFISPGVFTTEHDQSLIHNTKLETGRIEKGSVSNQYFSPINFEVGEEFYKIKFKLLPFSLKPVKKNSMIQTR